jgi:hypothetical protein
MGGLPFNLLEHNQNVNLDGVKLEGFGTEHAEIYDPTVPRVQNTGYMVGEKFFYPGDALFVPEKPVEILALPVAGPWIKTKEVIEYGLDVKPRICFPVHDALLSFTAPFHFQPQKAIAESRLSGGKKEVPKDEQTETVDPNKLSKEELKYYVDELEDQMDLAAKNLEFEVAAELRDKIDEVKKLRRLRKK